MLPRPPPRRWRRRGALICLCGRLDYRLPVPQKRAVSSAVEHCFHTAGATGSIPVPPTILHQAARGASVNPIVSRLPTAVAAFWTVSSRT
jgi:hypothetical protein